MNFEEHAAKPLLRSAGIATPDGEVVTQAPGAGVVAARFDGAVVKAQVPSGKRGKAGGIKVVASADEAVEAPMPHEAQEEWIVLSGDPESWGEQDVDVRALAREEAHRLATAQLTMTRMATR